MWSDVLQTILFGIQQVRIVKHAFEIISLVTDQNPIQVTVDAIINRCEEPSRSKFISLDSILAEQVAHGAVSHGRGYRIHWG